VLSRLIEIVICFPFLFLILAVIAFLPPNIYNIMIVIGITRWTEIARYARAEFVRLKAHEFTEAARALGARDMTIIFRHILPNSLAHVSGTGDSAAGAELGWRAGKRARTGLCVVADDLSGDRDLRYRDCL
jgi:ABC-type methionine transport system permease subunit